MKGTKTILSIALMLCVSLLMAQKNVGNVTPMNPINFSNAKTPTDTLMPTSFTTGTPVLYSVTPTYGGGYVVGTNGYGDLAKAQLFYVDEPYNIEGCLVWVGAKEIAGTPNTTKFVVYAANGTGEAESGTVNTAPGTELASVTVSMSELDTSLSLANAHVFTLTTPVPVTDMYYVGMDFTNTYDDTLGIVSTTDGDALGTELAWEQWDDGTWYSILAAWPLDFDLGFFPIVDMTPDNIQTSPINGVICNIYPNPAYGVTIIEYQLTQSSSNVEINILDVTGKLVKSFNEGAKDPGKYNVTFNASELQPGNYFYTINAGNGSKFAKKFQVK
jgi:hypothetical protein